MGQNWTVPVYKGEVQGLVLGCDMQSWDESGKTPPVYRKFSTKSIEKKCTAYM